MQCPSCRQELPEDARFCHGCGAEVKSLCPSCQAELPPQALFCPQCGSPVNPGRGGSKADHGAEERFCAGSGKPIRAGDAFFKCLDCNRLYLESYRFEDKPVCQTCAFESGMAQTLAEERQEAERRQAEQEKAEAARIQAEVEARLKAERQAQAADQRAREEAERKARETEAQRRREQLKLGVTEDDWADIPAGEFLMGSPEDEEGRGSNERQHRVRVAAFKLLKTPVTFAMFDAFCAATGRESPDDENWGRLDRPVIYVSYWDAVDYAQWLSEQTGWQLRLPTEAEWEYACRAGTTTAYWMGNRIDQSLANYGGGILAADEEKAKAKERTTPVAYYKPNPWGLYDTHGNVSEWCASEYDKDYGGLEQRDASQDRSNDALRVLRGGSWSTFASDLRAAGRDYHYEPTSRLRNLGFRLARI